MAFAEDAVQAQKILKRRGELPDLRRIVLFDASGGLPGDALSLPDLAALGRQWEASHPGALEAAAKAAGPFDLATIIYTSGTTGRPKGVELPHDCWLFVAESVEKTGVIGPSDLQYFWLPLAHVFGKAVIAVCIGIGIPTAVDGRVDRIGENLAVVKPTFVGAVPRIFEKIHGKVLGQALAAGGLKAAIFRWAVGVGSKVASERQAGRGPGPWLRSSTASRTASSSTRSGTGSADGSASSSRGARRSRGSSESSSTPST